MDVEATETGYLRKIVQTGGMEVNVNEIVAYIGAADEAIPIGVAGGRIEPDEAPVGNAPGGRIIGADILAYFEKKCPGKFDAICAEGRIRIRSTSPLASVRRVIAERVQQSKQTIPHIVLNAKANATALIDTRKALQAKASSRHKINIT